MPDTSFLARTHALESGSRVRVRLARRSDAAAAHELLRARGVEATELEVRRALSFDPARRRVFCALTSDGSRERLVGLAAVELGARPEIDTLVVDEQCAPGLTTLFSVLLERVAVPRRRAA